MGVAIVQTTYATGAGLAKQQPAHAHRDPSRAEPPQVLTR